MRLFTLTDIPVANWRSLALFLAAAKCEVINSEHADLFNRRDITEMMSLVAMPWPGFHDQPDFSRIKGYLFNL